MRDSCRLPAEFIHKEHLQFNDVIAIEIIYLESAQETIFCKWNGDVSQKYMDCIEIQGDDVVSVESRVASIRIHRHIQPAGEVFVHTSSRYDWEILNSQPQAVEDIVLKQV